MLGSSFRDGCEEIWGIVEIMVQIDEIFMEIKGIHGISGNGLAKINWSMFSQRRRLYFQLIKERSKVIIIQKKEFLGQLQLRYTLLSSGDLNGIFQLRIFQDSGEVSVFIRVGDWECFLFYDSKFGKRNIGIISKFFSSTNVGILIVLIYHVHIWQNQFVINMKFRIQLIDKVWSLGCLVFIVIMGKRFYISQQALSFTSFYSLTHDLVSCILFWWFTMTQGQWIAKSGGKKEVAKAVLKITVPRFDNSELIASYDKTLIGRCMNPQKQDMKILLFMLPKIWQVEGRAVGVDLGLGRFQFDFDLEEDIVEVMKMEPFHFDYWMVSLVRWKPVLEVNYPSKIIFWVRILDIPLQFWVPQIFQGVGEAIGKVQREVDLYEGRVRVEIDGFKPLVFSMAVEIGEGVEIMVSLRYEKLFGFCRECFSLTHDQSRCPSLRKEVEVESEVKGDSADHGSHVTSFKAAVSTGRDGNGDRRVGQESQVKVFGDRNKGKGIARQKPGPYRQEGSYHAYKERIPRGGGEGSSLHGRQSGYPVRRNDLHRDVQQVRNGAEDQQLNPQKLMLDAFKGLNHSSGPKTVAAEGSATSSKAHKALLFNEAPTAVSTVNITEGAVEVPSKVETMLVEAELKEVQVQRVPEGLVTQGSLQDESMPTQALDDANLMVEGVILSDSELMIEEDNDEIQDWEQGEITDFMEEEVMGVEDEGGAEIEGGVEYNEVNLKLQEEEVGKATKKNAAKAETGMVAGATKKRGVQVFLSPRKKLLAKAISNVGDKGVAPTKKASIKPKNPSE